MPALISSNWRSAQESVYPTQPVSLPVFFCRFDASISFIKAKKWGERRWVIGVYNAYSRANPFYIDTKSDYSYNKNGELSERTKFVQYSLFPIIPSISYQFKF